MKTIALALIMAVTAVLSGPDRAGDLISALARSGKTEAGDLVHLAATLMMGTPYVAGTLDEGETEQVVVDLGRTDCIIFVETCLDLALAVKEKGEEACYGDLVRFVGLTRYRSGAEAPLRYSDRLHYTSEWISHGEELGVLEDLTLDLGGCGRVHPLDFMSTHPRLYPRLAAWETDPVAAEELERIREAERELNSKGYTYIPASGIEKAGRLIRNGDIICFVTSVSGLDISHVAIASVKDGKVGFIHASSTAGKVVEDVKSIAAYVAGRKSLVGIKVVRPVFNIFWYICFSAV